MHPLTVVNVQVPDWGRNGILRLVFSLFEREWPKFHNCRIIHRDRIKIHTPYTTLANFEMISEFS